MTDTSRSSHPSPEPRTSFDPKGTVNDSTPGAYAPMPSSWPGTGSCSLQVLCSAGSSSGESSAGFTDRSLPGPCVGRDSRRPVRPTVALISTLLGVSRAVGVRPARIGKPHALDQRAGFNATLSRIRWVVGLRSMSSASVGPFSLLPHRLPWSEHHFARVAEPGRRAGLRIRCPKGRGGSNPPSRTPVARDDLGRIVPDACSAHGYGPRRATASSSS